MLFEFESTKNDFGSSSTSLQSRDNDMLDNPFSFHVNHHVDDCFGIILFPTKKEKEKFFALGIAAV